MTKEPTHWLKVYPTTLLSTPLSKYLLTLLCIIFNASFPIISHSLFENNIGDEAEEAIAKAMSFLYDRRNGDEIIYRLKIIVVGPGNAGKTTLVHRLSTDSFQEGQFAMTDGIVMQDISFDDIHYSVWDFGGQELYLNSHAMFMTNRAVILLVWDPRADASLSVLEPYLHSIRDRNIEAPIVMVSTHADERGDPVNEAFLNRIRNFHGALAADSPYFPIDSRSGTGINMLKSGLSELCRELPFVQCKVPGSYVKLENVLKRRRQSNFSVSLDEFTKLALDHRIENPSLVLDLFDQWGVVKVLRDGDIVLNPQQLADALTKVVSCAKETLKGNRWLEDGILRHGELYL